MSTTHALHEASDQLSSEVIDRHRAIASLVEELEAIDWYDQRVAVCSDRELCAILVHNRDEETEHAAMLLEWLRRHSQVLDRHLRKHLFQEGPIAAKDEDAERQIPTSPEATSLAIGSLRRQVS